MVRMRVSTDVSEVTVQWIGPCSWERVTVTSRFLSVHKWKSMHCFTACFYVSRARHRLNHQDTLKLVMSFDVHVLML